MNNFYNKVFRNGVIYVYDYDAIDNGELDVFRLKPEESLFCGGLVPHRAFYHLGKELSILRKAGFIVIPETDEAAYNVYKGRICSTNWVGRVWLSYNNDSDTITVKHIIFKDIIDSISISN